MAKTVNKNWVTFENYFQVTFSVTRGTGMLYLTYCKLIVGKKRFRKTRSYPYTLEVCRFNYLASSLKIFVSTTAWVIECNTKQFGFTARHIRQFDGIEIENYSNKLSTCTMKHVHCLWHMSFYKYLQFLGQSYERKGHETTAKL